MAAQLAPLLITELIPYFLNRPISCAMTIVEQSVKAMMPILSSGVSGASSAKTEPTQPVGSPLSKAERPIPLADADKNPRRVTPTDDRSGKVPRFVERSRFPHFSIFNNFPFPEFSLSIPEDETGNLPALGASPRLYSRPGQF
jgi:hypothetical protein